MLRQEENTGVFILGQRKRNLHSSRSGNTGKVLMGCFQPLPAAVGGLLERFAKGHQPKLHLHLHLLLPCAAHHDGLSWREWDHLPIVWSHRIPNLQRAERWEPLTSAISPQETILLPLQSETLSLQSGSKCQGEVSMPFILPMSPNWKLGNNTVQCRCCSAAPSHCSVLLMGPAIPLVPGREIPLWQNMMALRRGNEPGFKKHWAHCKGR